MRATNNKVCSAFQRVVIRCHKDTGYELDKDVRGWRLTNAKGSVDISPRCTSKEMITWLDAYVAGWEACHQHFSDTGNIR